MEGKGVQNISPIYNYKDNRDTCAESILSLQLMYKME